MRKLKTALLKDGIKEIKNSYKRFISILLIVLLGVGFFAGLRAASPDMKKTLDTYFDEYNVMDIQVISTLGLTEDDITAIQEVENVDMVEGSYQTDAIVDIDGEEVVVKLETYSDSLNKLELVDGRMPENEKECVVEYTFLERTGHSIGDKIKIEVEDITNDEEEEEKVLKNDEVTIVGAVKSPLYISTERGSTKLGSGVIDYYMYVPKENINVDMYTNIYLTVNGAKDLNSTSDKYTDLVNEVEDSLDAISEERREARYNELYDSANSKIEDAQKELDEEKEKAEKELEDAQKEIDDGKKEIEDGRKELEASRASANRQFSQAEQEIADGKAEIEKQEADFETSKKEAEAQIEEYQAQLDTLKQTKTQLSSLEENLDSAKASLEALNKKLETASEEEIQEIQSQINQVNVQIQTLQGTISAIESGLQSQGVTDLDKTIESLEEGISSAKKQLSDGEKAIEEAKKELEDAED